MRILFLCESEHGGGAMRSAWRQLTALRGLGQEVGMIARLPATGDPAVLGPRSRVGRGWAQMRRRLDGLPLRAYSDRQPVFFSPAWLPDAVGEQIAAWRPDVVHVHWINNGFISIRTLGRIRVPQVWTMHDSWAFTGGCHYGECQRFSSACGACPVLASTQDHDLSRRIHQHKAAAWSKIAPHLVAPSRWMAGRAAASSLCGRWPLSVIPNPIDHAIYAPTDRQAARRRLGLPLDRRLVLFSALHADDHNKGLDLLRPALRRLASLDPLAMLVGIGHPPKAGYGDLGMPAQSLGALADETAVATVTGAVDAVAVPSRSENLPFGVLEAQACGAVPVAFRIGGIPDLIEHRRTGWLAEPFDCEDLAHGLAWALSPQAPSAGELARATSRCAVQQVAQAHLDVYNVAASRTSPSGPPT